MKKADAREGRIRAARRNVTIPLTARNGRDKEDGVLLRLIAVLLSLLLRSSIARTEGGGGGGIFRLSK